MTPPRLLPSRLPVLALALLGSFWVIATAHAELTWTTKKLELQSDMTSPTLEGRFHFTNSGAKAVDVARVVTSCGCTSAELKEHHFEPGQSGDVVITYHRGGRAGLQRNLIAVESSDQVLPTRLTLLVHLPEVLRIEPLVVTWMHAEEKAPKAMLLKLAVPGKVTRIGVQSSDASMSTALEPVAVGREYRLLVTPHDVSRFLKAELTVTCELDGKDVKTFVCYATVMPPEN